MNSNCLDGSLHSRREEATEFSCTLNGLGVFGGKVRVSGTVETILELMTVAKIAE